MTSQSPFANIGPDNGRWKGGLEPYVARATQLLRDVPMTRYELQCSLGTDQQRVSEVLRLLGAQVVGQQPPPGKRGRPSPIYGLDEQQQPVSRPTIGRVSSVWQLGAQA